MQAPERTSSTAVIALLLGLFSFACLWGIGGVLAVVLGIAARQEIARSEGRLRGSGLATAAVALGVVHLVAIVIGTGVLVAFWARPERPSAALRPSPIAVPGPRPPRAKPRASEELGGLTRDSGVRETELGQVTLVDIHPGVESLRTALDAQRMRAERHGRRVLLFTVVSPCAPCNGVALSLRDERMQKALSGVRLVRVDIREFAADLRALGVPIDTYPGFSLLAPSNRPLDYVHGGEWDADVAPNIAPVLSAFVRGTYLERRHPWEGLERPDQTAL